jgi:hypothetical protein
MAVTLVDPASVIPSLSINRDCHLQTIWFCVMPVMVFSEMPGWYREYDWMGFARSLLNIAITLPRKSRLLNIAITLPRKSRITYLKSIGLRNALLIPWVAAVPCELTTR